MNPTVRAFWTREPGSYLQQVEVTNNNTKSGTIYAGESSPTTNFGTIAAGAKRTITIGTAPGQPVEGAMFWAYVQIKGGFTSDIISQRSSEYLN